MRILGIETSCDETSAAVIEADNTDQKVTLLSNVVASSVALHAKTGGIIPEIAAREQIKYIIPVIEEALKQASSVQRLASSSSTDKPKTDNRNTIPDIDAIAVTIGPGLIGSLLVGVETAKTLAYVWNKPIIPVNHLYGHIYANFISKNLKSETKNPELNAKRLTLDAHIEFPALALIVSGGHTDLVLIKDHKQIEWISGTRDDAAGEAFDKIGRLLSLPYPAGAIIEKLAARGNPKAFHFPRPLLHEDTLDFSFSGLKTAALREVQRLEKTSFGLSFRPSEQRVEAPPHSGKSLYGGSQSTDLKNTPESIILSKSHKRDSSTSFHGVYTEPVECARNDKFDEQTIADLSRATQDAIIDVLVNKTLKAAEKYQVKSILLGGGVAANQMIVEKLKLDARRLTLNASLSVPPKNLCTDNGAMIASAAFYNYKEVPWQEVTANPELYFD